MGYVGLPLAVAFSKKFKVIGFDINKNRINELNIGKDTTLEVKNLKKKKIIYFLLFKNLNWKIVMYLLLQYQLR